MAITRRAAFAALGFAAFSFAVNAMVGPAQAADPLKVGFVYVGPIGDHGYSYQHNEGRLAVEKHFGDKVKTTFVENVPEGADAERVIRKLASTGYDLIFTTSFGFMNPTVKVAKRFPKVKFEHATGYKQSKNLATYTARFYEGRYIAGVAAGRLTKSNKLGYIGAFPIPEVVRGANAFLLGARTVNPKATLNVVWANTWYDPGKEREAAEALMAQGVDVLSQHTDSSAPVQAAEEKGVWAIGQASDMSKFGPKSQLTAIVDDWSGYYIKRVQMVMDGTWKTGDTWDGVDEGMVVLAPFNPAVPKDIKAEAMKVMADIKSHKLNPFHGPIRNQSGKIVVKEGEILSDKDLLSMDYFVEGVIGSVPK